MSERTSYTPGTPSWVDLATPDVDAAAEFYAGLFGWSTPERPDSAEMGGYRRASKDGADVAGMFPLMQEGQPPVWSTYVSVEDADATVAAAKEAGGNVIAEPMDISDFGRMAVFSDPTGAVIGIWQPNAFPGAGRVNETGAFGWNELATRDPEAAKAFYPSVFGWSFDEEDMGEMGTYVMWKAGDALVGGMLDMRGMMPDAIPPHWLTYFGVDDADAAVEKIKELGGELNFGPIDIPVGRFATVNDPFGARFAVLSRNEEAQASA
jgi:predicted enzyme related to lactoylglutathione lyase